MRAGAWARRAGGEAAALGGGCGQLAAAVGVQAGAGHVQRLHTRAIESRLRAGQMLAGLTRRELEILQLLTKGASSASIAADLYISPKTVRTHTQNILKKLGVHSKLEAVALVARSRSE